ncbi:hypothetical protein WICPIJ_005676 [Wickerhamomyces pijperi]|uniref:Methyltransferase small domain-containing protein n=1 Tax=Wickerhamomyces pijperi TaxID=599730 RepID=A0A9P8Q340_WICPI|nr:hypothetical protein WICPIJ_005676 [Wickerhamomyces pijperi]
MSYPTPSTSHLSFDQIYEPSEDTFLILDTLESEQSYILSHFPNKLPIFLEVGTGSGVITTFTHHNILKDALFLTTDLNPHACQAVKQTSSNNGGTKFLDSTQMSLASGMRDHLIDILVFNPPYVPDEIVPDVPQSDDAYEWLDLALLGGADGMVVTNVLLDDLHRIMSKEGIVYILFCARNKPELAVKRLQSLGWYGIKVGERRTGEGLTVYRFTRCA